jgi:hypothetical protein
MSYSLMFLLDTSIKTWRSAMPTLSDARLSIQVSSGSPNATVNGSVDVSFSATEETLIRLLSLNYKVTCRIRGADSFLTGGDDALFTLGNVFVNSDRNNISFSRVVSRDMLDEDTGSRDEVYARFFCTPPTDTGLALTAATPINSPEISGSF